MRPAPPPGAVLGDLLEEVVVRVEEEGHLGCEFIDRHPAPVDDLVAVRHRVLQGEGHLLRSVGASVTEVRAGDGHRVEARHLVGAELDRVRDQAERRRGRPDPRAARDVLLEDVVLHRAPHLITRHALLVSDRDVEGEHDGGGPVDRPRRRDAIERDVPEEDLGVGERVEGDADPADLLFDVGVVGVVADLGGQVGRHRESRAALFEQELVPLVGPLGGTETRVLAERPEPVAVAPRVVAAREGVFAGRPDALDVSRIEIIGPVAALDDETCFGREILVSHR